MPPTDSALSPSTGSRWRRDAVEPLLRAYAAEPGVQVVLLSGSTARGDADRWSDVEIGVFWSAPPEDAVRTRLAATGGARHCQLFAYDEPEKVWCDDLHLGASLPDGLLVEVVHTLTASTERLLDTVLVQYSSHSAGLNAMQGLVDGIAFHGGDLVERWKSRVTHYPRELAVAVIESAGVIDHFWRWEMLVERRNPVLLAGMFSAVCEQVLGVLLALNRRYGPKPKWLDSLTDSLDIAPRDLGDRLRRVFSGDPAAAAVLLAQLVEETFDLVETYLPEVDVDRLRRIFRHHRSPLDQLPSA